MSNETFNDATPSRGPAARNADSPGTIIPCLAGFFELRPPGLFEDERNLRRSAVIAWEVHGGMALPITADPAPCGQALPYAIEFPDGHVEAENTSWKSVQHYCQSNNLGPVELLDE
jgi:hypothetical protein